MKYTFLAFLLISAASTLPGQQPVAPPKGEPTNAAEAAAKKAAQNAATAEKYAALVATLSPDEQAWERIL